MVLIDLYRDSVSAFAAKVALIRPGQWTAPTPCLDWDVRALVNHVVQEQRWSVPLFAGATVAQTGSRFDGDVLGDDPVHAAAEAAEDAKAAVSEPGVLERTVHLSMGDTPGAEYIQQLLADHLVHSWDLAVATGIDRQLDDQACRVCLDWFAGREEMYRGAGAIGPRPDVASAHPRAQDLLLAAFGRDPGLRI
jgi:uncharacterized protein (TIGR03086 family)